MLATNFIDKFRNVFVKNRDSLAILDSSTDARFSYNDLEDLSSKLAVRLSQYVKRADFIVVFLPNCPETIISYLACMQMGAVSVPINWKFSKEEIKELLDAASPKLLITNTEGLEKFPTNLSCPIIRWEDSKDVDTLSIESISKMSRFHRSLFPTIEDDNIAQVFYSSGTTGIPKAIPIRFGRLVGHAFMFVQTHVLTEKCRFYNILPLSYLGGWYNLTLVPLLSGGTVVLDQEFGISGIYSYWRKCLDYEVNCVWFTPSILSALLAIGPEDKSQAENIKNRIQWGMVGMAPLPTPLKEKFERTFGFKLQQSYGLSETFLFTSWASNTTLPPNSVGKILPGYEVKINESMHAEGEILVKGKWVFDGYLNQDKLPDAFDDLGYFKTGDIGSMDTEGNLYITGRLKDIIVRGGENISPKEIERVLHGIDGITEAAVVGIEDKIYGEKIVAFVTSRSTHLTELEILNLCSKSLNPSKIPSSVYILKEMPLNPSGKVNKKILKEMIIRGKKS